MSDVFFLYWEMTAFLAPNRQFATQQKKRAKFGDLTYRKKSEAFFCLLYRSSLKDHEQMNRSTCNGMLSFNGYISIVDLNKNAPIFLLNKLFLLNMWGSACAINHETLFQAILFDMNVNFISTSFVRQRFLCMLSTKFFIYFFFPSEK